MDVGDTKRNQDLINAINNDETFANMAEVLHLILNPDKTKVVQKLDRLTNTWVVIKNPSFINIVDSYRVKTIN